MGLVSCEVGRCTFVKESQVPPSHGIKQASLAYGMLHLNFNSPGMNGFREAVDEFLELI